MRLFYTLGFISLIRLLSKPFHTTRIYRPDACEGCEFLDEADNFEN